MPNPWDADIEVSEQMVTRLLADQCPALNVDSIEPFGTGWDNAAFLVNGRLVFRFPRRQMGAGLIKNEIRILPRLAPHLPLPISVPTFSGAPDESYPYPFAGYLVIPGTTACRLPLTNEDRERNAVALAQFLYALHRIPVPPEAMVDGPGDEIDRSNLLKRLPTVKQRLRGFTPNLPDIDAATILALLDRLALTPARQEPPCWVHGDLYARHLLMDASHDLAGIIDWGDVHLGDPALDLSIAFSFLPPTGRGAFRQAYGDIDHATWDRARFRAVHYGVVLFEYGVETDDAAIRGAGEYALANAPNGV